MITKKTLNEFLDSDESNNYDLILSDPDRIHLRSQRDNRNNPIGTCNVTSMAMFLLINGIITEDKFKSYYSFDKDEQMEDCIYKLLYDNSKIDNFYKKSDWYKNTNYRNYYNREEIHSVISYSLNLIDSDLNSNNNKKFGFSTRLSVSSIIRKLMNGEALIASGKFPYYSRKQEKNIFIHHIVCVVGLLTSKTSTDNKIDSFIIYDPYGNYHDEYKTGFVDSGIIVSMKDFYSYIKSGNENKKMCHFILDKKGE